MLANANLIVQIPVVELDRALTFYTEVLGLQRYEMPDLGGIALLAAGGTQIMLYQRAPTQADHTIAAFVVDDLESTVAELGERGVVFEQYVLNDLVATDERGIATMGPAQAAWFKDTEGNILALNNKMDA